MHPVTSYEQKSNSHKLQILGNLVIITLSPIYQERSRVLLRFADLLEKHRADLAAIETWDNGKPYKQSMDTEIPMVIRTIRYYAGKRSKLIFFS